MRDGVAELVRVNPGLRKIVIITEKIAVHDAREIRAMAQANGCLLYTSDAADERSSVDLGGRRIIKKKNKYTE